MATGKDLTLEKQMNHKLIQAQTAGTDKRQNNSRLGL